MIWFLLSAGMETQVHCKGYLPAYYSMSYVSEDLNNRLPLHYGEKILTNAQYCNGFMSRTTIDLDPGYDKDVLKQKILEHEETFKNQVILSLVVNVHFSVKLRKLKV